MTLVLADVVWPELRAASPTAAWWCIAASLAIEAAALWGFARMRPLKAIAASLVMNGASAAFGALVLPLAGLDLAALASFAVKPSWGWAELAPVGSVTGWLFAAALSTLIETCVLWLVFLMPWTRRLMLVVLAANAVTTAMAAVTVMLFGMPLRG